MKEEKICIACKRAFSWRKKWKKNWNQVRYCSQACRSGAYQKAKNEQKNKGLCTNPKKS